MKKITDTPFLPTDVNIEKISDKVAKITASPFESGYAVTLAHPLRRILMSSTKGFAPIAVKIEGVKHEFDALRGMLEDVAVFIINLKNIGFIVKGTTEAQIEVEYSFDGSKEIKASDLNTENVEVVNENAHLATINADCNLTFSIILQRGIGYIPSEEIRDMIPSNYIPLDAFFSPIKKVDYNIEKMLVEDNPNYEKIVFYVETDGEMSPVDAFKEAVSVMYSQMSVFNKVFDLNDLALPDSSEEPEEIKSLTQKIEDLNLSARSFNSLDRAGIKYLGELVLMSEIEVKNIKNLGKKSYDEISEKLSGLGFPIDYTLPENVASALRRKLEQLKA
ncbi:MAG: DNA-directed RNA polymerase subunit alpha [Arcobacter butzleri]|jgi:DNA-directed RNA polymerase subunit alpha|nr:DNA-directed RNA polymerase subunit alpha [Arcobacteraceae bacterium]MDY0364307.1 DNA-directed RNA polymerase subunit alpha [Arcobacteraceae bacterium]NLO16777.1 DNA-directed RNA polymerase subunit alpha [Aliarcobacter butzleri]